MIQVAGVNFEDPIVIASGIVPPTKEYMQNVCEKYEPSAITSKTLTYSPLEPHRSPTFVKISDNCYLNAIGLGNPGIQILRDLGEIKCKLIISIGGSNVNEYIDAVSKINDIPVMIELNVSSPNRRGFGESNLTYVEEIVKNVKSIVKKPVFVKLGPWDNIVEIAGRALSAGADGLTLINTLKGMLIDVEDFKPILSYGTGGISGKCIHALAVRVIHDVFKEYEPEIIGVGGVFDWRDAIELISVGAKLVGLGTVLVEKGFDVIREIREGIGTYLEEKGLKVEEIRGIGVKR
ncbi:dihydroorotate dehydrogenase PyrD [Sulfolobus acidocaldarius]|uniref:Dihydroorotate dehydrogenase B (NAD(+)), catalytic subunit n=4 Tax=Sulfolobus acidocaldarius TaxID=2285 RepID=PYRDB_SULAC|nr:dihydroorotate dehydrogenase PyrD [Sulfolobus acidocaldarius]O08358.2 RecName: Full=Dihydroorotate dehydrogenase B (NAD(+)), catalytic subunit; Short=DHOD B; Short=DHODase B; Short=DHOdehase B; AltName: Full=Dihydroorotate oxidase B; AltName: Full=Orotate reductase (NADH) [Sulfolobus acidocaldarius DSM 639]AAY80905.1 dihydroorotate dehydrogenase [Sulfolobus acidocaldarius DSM 639]AGE71505.1 dihydroorotate dehydrogenase family protein [Sulfolobus acidocaldarius N8]AGE73778.1 dihydroorotate de